MQGLFWETSRLLLHFTYQQALIQAPPKPSPKSKSATETPGDVGFELPVDPHISAESPRQGFSLESETEIQVANCP